MTPELCQPKTAVAPKAFICHATDDKERFVFRFARRLREKGVDAWLDAWEMTPGDSLVDKIFEEGIKTADVFIVVLSENSVSKRWVREELNAAFVKRVSKSCKIIPIVIDDCDVPECLQSTMWQKIRNVEAFEEELTRITNGIFGLNEKPSLGSPPRHTETAIDSFPELTKADNVVLLAACERVLETDSRLVSPDEIQQHIQAQGISESEFQESLDILDSRGYIDATKALRGTTVAFRVEPETFDEYAKSRLVDYDKLVTDVSLRILNRDQGLDSEIAKETGRPVRLIRHIFEMLELRGLVKLAKSTRGPSTVVHVSAELKRMFR